MNILLRLIYVTVFSVTAFVAIGQPKLNQNLRYEVELSWKEEPYELINGGQVGIFLYRFIPDYSFSKRGWELVMLDASFEEKWKVKLEEENTYNITGYDVGKDRLTLMLEPNFDISRNIRFKSFDFKTGEEEQFEVPYPLQFEMTHFEIMGERVIFGGSYDARPVVILSNHITQNNITLPGLFKEHARLLDISLDKENDRFSVMILERNDFRKNTLSVKTFDLDGLMLEDLSLDIENHKSLISGKISPYTPRGRVITGTYGSTRQSFPEGFFTALIDFEGRQRLNYFPFGQLENFFYFQPDGKVERLKNRHKGDDRKVGRPISYKILPHEILPYSEGFVFSFNIVKPGARVVRSRAAPLSGGSRVYTMENNAIWVPQFSEVNNVHMGYVVLGINTSGDMLWDNMMPLHNMVNETSTSNVAMAIDGRRITIGYNVENEIRYQVTEGKSVVLAKESAPVEMKLEGDRERAFRSDYYGISSWFGRYFLAYGIQRLRNPNLESNKTDRRVFYVNRLYIE